VKPPCTAIGGIGGALDEPRLLETIDDTRQGDRLYVEHVRQLDLAKTRVSVEPEQHLPLRARDSESDCATIERLAQCVRRLTDFERKSFHFLLIPLRRETDIVSLLILSNT
jgi:hypothetical protein